VQPKTKVRALIIGLILPYFTFLLYFLLRLQEHPLPTWLPYFCLTYLLGSMILVVTFGRKITRGEQPQSVQKLQPARRSMLRTSAGYLIAVWCGLFLWGAYQAIKGHLAWEMALPAGAFLLAFIALFGRLLYSDIKPSSQPVTTTEAKATSTKV
jgi:cytochrome bd-type quinol oxidase subunit 2